MDNDWVVYKLKLSGGYLHLNLRKKDYLYLLKRFTWTDRILIKEGLSENASIRFCQVCRKLTRD